MRAITTKTFETVLEVSPHKIIYVSNWLDFDMCVGLDLENVKAFLSGVP